MKLKLPSSVSSPQDLTTLQLEIREYAQWFRHEAIKRRVNAKHTSEHPALSPAATELLRELDGKKAHNQEGLDDLLTMLDDYKKNAATMTITLAAPPPNSLKATLVGWCRDNIAPNVMVTFRFNSALLGGMTVQCGSRVFDWSFRRQLLGAHQAFPEVLRRV